MRRLRVLIQHLPPESATMTALRNDQPEQPERSGEGSDPAQGRWSQGEMLLAAIADELRYLRHDYITAHTAKKSKRARPPHPIPRPGVKPRRPKLKAAQNEFLFRHINGLEQPEHVQVAIRGPRGGG